MKEMVQDFLDRLGVNTHPDIVIFLFSWFLFVAVVSIFASGMTWID